MLDLQTYVLYELFVARQKETFNESARGRREAGRQPRRRALVARVLAALGEGLVVSGRKLKQRYEPVAGRRVQTQN